MRHSPRHRKLLFLQWRLRGKRSTSRLRLTSCKVLLSLLSIIHQRSDSGCEGQDDDALDQVVVEQFGIVVLVAFFVFGTVVVVVGRCAVDVVWVAVVVGCSFIPFLQELAERWTLLGFWVYDC